MWQAGNQPGRHAVCNSKRGLTNYSFIWHSLMIIDELPGSQLLIINNSQPCIYPCVVRKSNRGRPIARIGTTTHRGLRWSATGTYHSVAVTSLRWNQAPINRAPVCKEVAIFRGVPIPAMGCQLIDANLWKLLVFSISLFIRQTVESAHFGVFNMPQTTW